jgi:WD40 repeat protein
MPEVSPTRYGGGPTDGLTYPSPAPVDPEPANPPPSLPAPLTIWPSEAGYGYSAAISPEGSVLATDYGPSGKTYLWNGSTGDFVLAVTDPDTQGNEPATVSPDGTMLATVDIDGSAYLWSTATGKLLATLGVWPTATRLLFAAAFSPDGKVLATTDTNGGDIYLWNVATHKLLAAFGDSDVAPTNLAFLLDGKALAVVEGVASAYLWDIATRSRVGVLTDPNSKGVYWLAVSPNGRMLATADGNGSTYLWAITVHRPR